MFLLLTQILLWLLIGVTLWYILLSFIPRAYFTWLGGLLIFVFIVLAFFEPTNRTVSSVWSLLSLPLQPLGLVILLLASALRNGYKKVVGNQVMIALIVLLISSLPVFSYWVAQQAEQSAVRSEEIRRGICQGFCPTQTPADAAQRASAIVVLGQGATQPYGNQVELTSAGDRILYASRIYREQVQQNNRPVVIVSAGPRDELEGRQEDINEARDIRTILSNLGIPSDSIVLEPRGTDARSSAQEVKRILDQRRLDNRVILISSALESRRAALAFEKLGVRTISRPADFVSYAPPSTATTPQTTTTPGTTPAQPANAPRRRIRIRDFIPSVDALAVTTRVVQEYLTSVYYFLRGWLTPISF